MRGVTAARLITHPLARPPWSGLGEVGVANVQKGLGGSGVTRRWAARGVLERAPGMVRS